MNLSFTGRVHSKRHFSSFHQQKDYTNTCYSLKVHLPKSFSTFFMSTNLARQISHDLHSHCFAMFLTAGFYCDSQAHDVEKVRVVKYIVVYGQIKAANQKYCHNQKRRRKTPRNKLSNKRFSRQFRCFLAEIL